MKRKNDNLSKINHSYNNLDKNVQSVDWTNIESVITWTEEYLQSNYCLNVKLPHNRLCPPIPNRLNYLSWLNKILSYDTESSYDIKLLDIGTGASCIYPILGVKTYGWKFLASDIDVESLLIAQSNITNNLSLQSNIELVHVNDCNPLQTYIHQHLSHLQNGTMTLLSLLNQSISNIESSRGPIRNALYHHSSCRQLLEQLEQQYIHSQYTHTINTTTSSGDSTQDHEKKKKKTIQKNSYKLFSFTMCNPPFYDLNEEIIPNERTICTGTMNEMRTIGGEVIFICCMIIDSLILKDSITWYTTMIGKKSSLKILLNILTAVGITNIRTTRFTQGRTMRWGIAWSYTDIGYTQLSTVDKVLGWNKLRKKIKKSQVQIIGGKSFKKHHLTNEELDYYQQQLNLPNKIIEVNGDNTNGGLIDTSTLQELQIFQSKISRYLHSTTHVVQHIQGVHSIDNSTFKSVCRHILNYTDIMTLIENRISHSIQEYCHMSVTSSLSKSIHSLLNTINPTTQSCTEATAESFSSIQSGFKEAITYYATIKLFRSQDMNRIASSRKYHHYVSSQYMKNKGINPSTNTMEIPLNLSEVDKKNQNNLIPTQISLHRHQKVHFYVDNRNEVTNVKPQDFTVQVSEDSMMIDENTSNILQNAHMNTDVDINVYESTGNSQNEKDEEDEENDSDSDSEDSNRYDDDDDDDIYNDDNENEYHIPHISYTLSADTSIPIHTPTPLTRVPTTQQQQQKEQCILTRTTQGSLSIQLVLNSIQSEDRIIGYENNANTTIPTTTANNNSTYNQSIKVSDITAGIHMENSTQNHPSHHNLLLFPFEISVKCYELSPVLSTLSSSSVSSPTTSLPNILYKYTIECHMLPSMNSTMQSTITTSSTTNGNLNSNKALSTILNTQWNHLITSNIKIQEYHKFIEHLENDIQRTNRRWRRLLK